MKLRPYQVESVDSIFEEWKENTSTLLVLPTGCGKTQVFCEVARRSLPNRSMILVHRYELADQAKKRIQGLGIQCDLEMAGFKAKTGGSDFFGTSKLAPVIVSTIQTQISGSEEEKRMHRFKPDEFGIVIVDEAHHATSKSWVDTINYYKLNKNLKVLGVTATPDRADEMALGQVFDTVAYDYEILDAIKDGWLVPIRQQMVTIDGLDFSAMRTTAGDLNSGDLAEVMEAEKNLHGVVSASIDIIKDRRAIVFAVSVKQAEMYSEIFNRHKEGMSDWVCGKTPKEDRVDKLSRFKNGEVQVMVNVGVLTEGFDSPEVEVIIQARPTKSRSLYSQMVGRSTRPLPGLVDLYDTPEERTKAILESPKPYCLVVDFAGNSGRHKLMTTADILGGKYNDDQIMLAEYNAKKKGGEVDMQEELELAVEQLEKLRLAEIARRAKVIGKASYSINTLDPFDVLQIKPDRERGWDSGKSLSESQRAWLLKNGINPDERNYHANKQILNELGKRINSKLCSYKQAKALAKHGYDTKQMTFKDASAKLDLLSKNGWSRQRAEAALAQSKLPMEENPF